MKAPIVEIFESIQAEGASIGKPSIFIRFWGCSLHCQFAGKSCDTPYAVSTDREKALMMTDDEIVKKILTFNSSHIVFTGGECTLYQNMIVNIMDKLNYHTCEVETNATIPLTEDFIDVVNQFNMSVKLKGSNQLTEAFDKKRINHLAIETFPINKSYFKFVISNMDDIEEAKSISATFPEFDVWLMPEGMYREDVIKHSDFVVNQCIKNGWNFSPREHIIIWDTKRGV